jgi:hypothetical protein
MADLPPGPELDRLVTERVMGWQWNPERRRPTTESLTSAEWAARMADDTVRWSPSTSIAHAWEVVDRLTTLGLVVVVTSDRTRRKPWRVECGDIRTEASTAPLAISVAALKAVEAKLVEIDRQGDDLASRA